MPHRNAQRSPSEPLTIRGRLAQTPLSQVLVQLARKQVSGTLLLRIGQADSRVLFERGCPAKAQTPWPLPSVGEILVHTGRIDLETHRGTVAQAIHSGELHGAVLMRQGWVDEVTLRETLREQLSLRLLELFRRYDDESIFEFHPRRDSLRGWGGEPTPVDPWCVLWRGCAVRSADPWLRETLSVLGDAPVVVCPEAPLHRFGFGDTESRIAHWMREHAASVDALVGRGWLAPAQTRALLYVLFLTRCLAFSQRPGLRANGTSEPPRVTRAAPESGEMRRIPDPAHNPPRVEIPAPESERAEPKSERVLELDASLRRIYRSPLAVREQSAGPLSERKDAEPRMKAAGPGSGRVLREPRNDRRGTKPGRSEAAARAALERMPSNPDIRVELAWILAWQPERRDQGGLAEAMELAEAVIREHPERGRPYLVRGVVHAALGLHERAYGDFRAAVARDPACGDAADALGEYVRRYRATGSLDPAAESRNRSGLSAAISRLFKA